MVRRREALGPQVSAARSPGISRGSMRRRVAFVVFVVFRAGSEKLVPAPGVWHAQTSHGTWRHMFDLHGVAASIPLPLWIARLAGRGADRVPVRVGLRPCAPGPRLRGSRRVVGLMLVTWVTWWSSSLRLLPFGRGSIALGGARRRGRRGCSGAPAPARDEPVAARDGGSSLLVVRGASSGSSSRRCCSCAGRTPTSGIPLAAARSRWTSPT